MSLYLSLSAFARELGCSESDVRKLISEKRIKAHQLEGDEPFIRKTELDIVKTMISCEVPSTNKEEHIIQTDKDRVSRADSRAKIAAERVEGEAKLEQRRLKLSSGRKIP